MSTQNPEDGLVVTEAPFRKKMDKVMFTNSVEVEDVFEVAREGCECENDASRICCVGLWTPCCLLGATDKIVKNNFNINFDPCDGCGSCVCCGACAIEAFCGGFIAANLFQCLLG